MPTPFPESILVGPVPLNKTAPTSQYLAELFFAEAAGVGVSDMAAYGMARCWP